MRVRIYASTEEKHGAPFRQVKQRYLGRVGLSNHWGSPHEQAEQQAERARQNAAANEQDFRRQRDRDRGTIRANKGELTGSTLLSVEDFTAEAELAALRIRSGGEVRATRFEQEAELTRFKGRQAQTGSFFRAGSSLLSGIANARRFK